MTRSPAYAALIASVVTLGRCLDIRIAAEGVESEQEFQYLRASGINLVQGYLFGPPRPVYELEFDNFYQFELADDNDRATIAN